MTTNKALAKAVAIAGSQSELARRIGLKPQYVWNWLRAPRGVPAEHCRNIERAVNGRVTCAQLRPDVFGPVRRPRSPRRPAPEVLSGPEVVAEVRGE